MKPNFRIKDLIQHKGSRAENPSTQQEENTTDQNISKKDEIKLSTLLQSFEKIIGSLVDSNNNKNTTNSAKNGTRNLNRSDQVDFRDRFVIVDLPSFENKKVEEEKLETWLGELCAEILSVAFHYLTEKKMNYEQMKAFASESFLRNLEILADNAELTSNDVQFIDSTMKEKILPYLITKYPLTVEKEINKKLQSSVKSIDNSQMVENDYLYTSGVVFDYRSNGRYDDLIMKLLNQIMIRCDGESSKNQNLVSNFKEFQALMTNTFQKSFDLEWMSYEKAKEGFEHKIKHTFSDGSQEKTKEQEKYREQVKQYTSYLISRKVSENTQPYTDDQIQSKSMKIKSPTILRILTKWCEQLWSKFKNENYFWDRKDGLSLNGKQQICLIEEKVKKILTKEMRNEKQKLEKLNDKMNHINYTQQLKLLECELSRNESLYIEKYERVAGIFACKSVNNLESFIVDYLNSLIHALLQVSQNTFSSLGYYQRFIIKSPLNLLSFTVADILRCKYSSKEKEVLRIYKQLERMSIKNPEKFKIIRIKNRLLQSTNDILINAKLNNEIKCQIQIAVNTNQSDFMHCSNKINHFIYELQRAHYGPVLEMCSIWKTCDKRSEVFTKMIKNEKRKKKQKLKLEKKQENKLKMVPYRNPFVCSECSQHFYHNNYIVSHQSDVKEKYWKCAPCLIEENIASENLDFFFKNDKNKINEQVKKYQLCRNSKIPSNGACIMINRPVIKIQTFKKISYKLKEYLIRFQNQNFEIMKTISSDKERDQFFKDYIVFSLPDKYVNSLFGITNTDIKEQVISTIILPTYLKNCLKESRQSISILSEYTLSQVDMEKIIRENPDNLKSIKSIQFSDSNLRNLDLISPSFINLSRLVLNKNSIKNISKLCEITSLETIDLSLNLINEVPEKMSNLRKLKQIVLRQNKLEFVPKIIFQLESLSILNLTQNRIQQFQSLDQLPDNSVFLPNLTHFYLNKNKLKMIPDKLGELPKLTHLSLIQNNLTTVPEKLGELPNLTQLILRQNQLTTIPEKLGQLPNLTLLDLSQNKLTKIPEKLGELPNLTYLYLSRNKLTQVPEQLGQLQNLTHLYLRQNQLTKIPEKLGKLPKLTHLYLTENRLATVPEDFGELPRLTHLYLRSNQLATIPEKLGSLRNLTELDLGQNKLTQIPEKLGELPKLTHLYLSRNPLATIPEKLGQLRNLTNLYMRSTKLTMIPEKFSELSRLTQLDLSKNLFTIIPEKLIKKFPYLTRLIQPQKNEKFGQNSNT